MRWTFIALAVTLPLAVLAQALPDPGSDTFITEVLSAIARGDWRYCAVLVVLGLTFLARTYGPRLPGAVGVFFTTSKGGAIIALVLALVTGLAPPILGWQPWSLRVVLDALMAGLAAIGGWTGARRIFGVVPPNTEGATATGGPPVKPPVIVGPPA